MQRRGRRAFTLGGAFTLVEMLVAMVLTLILVAAIAEFYAYVGETVKDGRAMIEMSGSLRTAVQRLKTDLDLLTLPVAPSTDDAGTVLLPAIVVNNNPIFPDTLTPIGNGGLGYFEIFEGGACDCDVNNNNIVDLSDIAADLDGDGIPDWTEPNVTNLLGDGDDIIAFTIRAQGEPFTGRLALNMPALERAEHAEVIWWVGFDDLNGNGVWNLEEPRQIYRRQLLIYPNRGYGLFDNANPPNPRIGLIAEFTPANASTLSSAQQFLKNFWQNNDISASIRLENDSSGTQYWRIRANSLADLSRREYRFAHAAFNSTTGADNFPYPLALLPSRSAASPGVTVFNSYVQQGTGRGEDIVLTNILAFDVQVYDQGAILLADTSQSNLGSGPPNDAINALAPGDPGYLNALNASPMYPRIGFGAYVDLGYGVKLANLLTNQPYNNTSAVALVTNAYNVGSTYPRALFGASPNYFAQLGFVYDTWSMSYERDGLNQDWWDPNVYGPTFDGVANINTPPFDEGTDGLDNDGKNGVDDPGERETRPPYVQPLRGVQITIRMYEPGTRQMRQATVKADFISE
jgi:hypothetical protein